MKKFISLFLAMALLFSLSGCMSEISDKNKDIEELTQLEIYEEYILPLSYDGSLYYRTSMESMNEYSFFTLTNKYIYLVDDFDYNYYFENYEVVHYGDVGNILDHVYIPAEEFQTNIRKKFVLSDDYFSQFDEYLEDERYIVPINQKQHSVGRNFIDTNSINLEKTDTGYNINYETPMIIYPSALGVSVTTVLYNSTLNLVYDEELDAYKYNSFKSVINQDDFNNTTVAELYLENIKEILIYDFSKDDTSFLETTPDGVSANIIYAFLSKAASKYINSSDFEGDIRYTSSLLIDSYNAIFEIGGEEKLLNLIENSAFYKESEYDKGYTVFHFNEISHHLSNYYINILDFNITDDILTATYEIVPKDDGLDRFSGIVKLRLDGNDYTIIENKTT